MLKNIEVQNLKNFKVKFVFVRVRNLNQSLITWLRRINLRLIRNIWWYIPKVHLSVPVRINLCNKQALQLILVHTLMNRLGCAIWWSIYKLGFRVILVIFLLPWRNTKTKATYKIKNLICELMVPKAGSRAHDYNSREQGSR